MLIDSLQKRATEQPDSIAIIGESASLNYIQLMSEIELLASHLNGSCLGILMDNSPAWAIADLAALKLDITCVPLPHFFSNQQLLHSMNDAGIDIILTDQPALIQDLCKTRHSQVLTVAGQALYLFRLSNESRLPADVNISKITYTSGTTGTPKGVCLSGKAIAQIVESLITVTSASPKDVALSLLPLSTLLENIGGVYVPLLSGGCCTLVSLKSIGMRGASGLDIPVLLSAINQYQPSSMILIPQMLQVLTQAVMQGFDLTSSLRFIAVGGAPVSKTVMKQAINSGIPVYEGYGLSEMASVVCLNYPNQQRPGSVGRPLPHVQIRFTEDHEILVSGSMFTCYLGEDIHDKEFHATGDTGYMDDDGYLYLTGRKKNIFITSFGRNVSPEWVETELLTNPLIRQAVVFGEAMPYNIAIITADSMASSESISNAVSECNKTLPDYAQITKYLVSDEPFSINNGQLTGSGRVRRAEVLRCYKEAIQSLYEEVA